MPEFQEMYGQVFAMLGERIGIIAGVIAGVVVLLVLWFVSVIRCGALAHKKDRNVAGWIVMGIFFSWFGWILAGCVRSKKPEKPDKANVKWKCSSCGSINELNNKFCGNCGKKRGNLSQPQEDSQEEIETQTDNQSDNQEKVQEEVVE